MHLLTALLDWLCGVRLLNTAVAPRENFSDSHCSTSGTSKCHAAILTIELSIPMNQIESLLTVTASSSQASSELSKSHYLGFAGRKHRLDKPITYSSKYEIFRYIRNRSFRSMIFV
ncbi:hypothetical protein BKA67DRAFT_544605 [Truncatella angustata]|uniref:Secreted protein n=1 Tax=Truncatella angustata TaxID=152316 RepID=A0A9P8UW48_9PEZI|nr:uncharacterized protein BKA67DRAFT_544605 [Truncatella angustata]KAH6659488.1 hypothetical protein BKA67DRAFT_544605 [Truncatella angustata]